MLASLESLDDRVEASDSKRCRDMLNQCGEDRVVETRESGETAQVPYSRQVLWILWILSGD